MFAGSKVVINGGNFSHSVARTQASISFDYLAAKACPRAFHLADSDPSHATCFTNTRSTILDSLKRWASRSTLTRDKFVMWLNGAAGGGKTTIARTFAKWCDKEEGILLGEFFFSRGDGADNRLVSLAPTLAYRMAVHTLKDAKKPISNAISQDPHIFLASLHDQLKKLVLEPLDLVAPCGITPYVIILDGLDEILAPGDQQLLLNAITDTLYQHNPTLRIFICSRPEPTIVTAFNDPDSILSSISINLSLNDDVDSDTDIRTFLVENFKKIRKQLPYPPAGDWPTSNTIDYLVRKSSGQFVFAATVEKYVGSPNHRHNAVARLKHVLDLGLLPQIVDKKNHPFADLDALYSLILKTRSDTSVSIKAMGVCLQYPKYFDVVSPVQLSSVLGVDISETWAILYELASLLDASEYNIRQFHASFGDFLYDETRSLELYCNRADIVTDITCAILRRGRNPDELTYETMSHLLEDATPRPTLEEILVQMEPASIFGRSQRKRPKGTYSLIPLLRHIKRHMSQPAYQKVATYFDENFKLMLPQGRWTSKIFRYNQGNFNKKQNMQATETVLEEESDSSDGMPRLPSVSNTSDGYGLSDDELDDNTPMMRVMPL